MQVVTEFAQLLVSGIAIGCIYAIVTLGFVLIYKASEVVNFAQGDLMMVGAFLGYTMIGVLGLPFAVGVPLAVAGAAVIGALLDRIVLRPMVGQPTFSVVIVTLGLGFIIRSVVSGVPGWGTETYSFESPFSKGVATLGPLALSHEHLAIIATTIILVAALYLFFRFTSLGIAMQAASQNQLAAYFVGIPVKTMLSIIWAISAGAAALVGILLAPIAFVHVNMGFIGLKALPAAVLGGFGSIPGAVAGGLIIGVVESLAGFYLPEGFKDVAAYVVLLAVLTFRPQGLFAETTEKRV